MVTINDLENLTINRNSKYLAEILLLLLEGGKTKIDIAKSVLPVTRNEKRKSITFYICKKCRSKLSRKPRKGSRGVCSQCRTPFYTYLVGRRKSRENSRENFLEKTKERIVYREKIETNRKIAWYTNSTHTFKLLEENKFIHRRTDTYDINWQLLTKLFLSVIEKFCRESDLFSQETYEKFYKLLKLNRKTIFNYSFWKFLFNKRDEFYFPFNSILGFMNFVFLSLIISKEFQKYYPLKIVEIDGKKQYVGYDSYLRNILNVSSVVSDIVEEMYAKIPIWELEKMVVKNEDGSLIPMKSLLFKNGKTMVLGEDEKIYDYEKFGVRKGYHLVSDKLDDISKINVDDEFVQFLKKIYSYVFDEIEEKTPKGLEQFLKMGVKSLQTKNGYIPFGEFFGIDFDRKIERLLKL